MQLHGLWQDTREGKAVSGEELVTHGGPTSLHDLPLEPTELEQQLVLPPGLAEQPLPPHVPHNLWQQVLPSLTPCAQKGSGGSSGHWKHVALTPPGE